MTDPPFIPVAQVAALAAGVAATVLASRAVAAAAALAWRELDYRAGADPEVWLRALRR